MAAPHARLQIEETLRTSRDAAEWRIGWARLVLFGLGFIAALLIQQFSNNRLGPVLSYSVWVMLAACIYAAAVVFAVRKWGATLPLLLVIVVVDMGAMGAIFLVTRWLTGPPTPETLHYRALFPTFILPAALFCLTLLNSLRNSRAAAVVAGVAAQLVYWSVALWIMEPHPARTVAGVLLLLASGFALASALQARRS